MDPFMKYLLSLPKPASDDEVETFMEQDQPYINDDRIEDMVHDLCHKAVKAMVIEVYVPKEDVIVPFQYFHYGSEDPLGECRQGLVSHLKDQGKGDRYIDLMLSTFFKETHPFDDMDHEERLKQAAQTYRIEWEYAQSWQRIHDISERLLDSSEPDLVDKYSGRE